MYILRPDEKTTPVMLYTQQCLVRGEVVTKQNVLRVNIWLRTEGAPRYMHILKPQIILFGGGPAKMLSYSEVYFPISDAIAFHILPPAEEQLDYDPNEANRTMAPIELLVGTFLMKGSTRISTQTEIGVSLEMTRLSWLSIYDITVSNPSLPQMTPLQVPMALVSPNHVAFALP